MAKFLSGRHGQTVRAVLVASDETSIGRPFGDRRISNAMMMTKTKKCVSKSDLIRGRDVTLSSNPDLLSYDDR